ncbi:general stress protein [Methylomarinum vadi]|uniref:general stress protein n=1 Tax=Methylomarinum vadi TaxID=438855 RepID=UPI0004DF5BB8|nr:general stress protein [Methylomarinum vadi]
MRRIYFLVPNIDITRKVVEELRSQGIEDRHMHILAKRDTPLEDLPEANEFQKTDFIPAVERGAALGATTGLLAGLVGLRFAGFAIAGGPILGILFYGATIGAIMSGLAGLQVGNSKVKQYEEAIEQGEFLVMVDIPKERIEEISQSITKHHPKAEFEGIEPILPPGYK